MALEETGVKLVVQGEAAFNSAMQKAMAVSVAMGQAIYNAALAAGRAFVDFASSSISAASDLNETMSKSQVVFGSAAGVVEQFAATSATALGMSKNAAVGAAATYGNLFRSMGMGEKASATMSTNLVQLAADLASFNNIDPTEALEKLRAGLTGESEPLKSLGVNINETLIRQEALNMGLVKGKEPLTALAKAQASYSLIMKQTALAQGDFARTSTGLANQQRIFAANLENTKAKLGTVLLPVINRVMDALNKLFSNPKVQAGIDAFMNGVAKIAEFLVTIAEDILGGDIGLAFDDFREGLYSLFPPEMEGMITVFNQALGAVWETVSHLIRIFSNLFSDLSQGSTIIGAIIDTFDGMIPDWILDALLTFDEAIQNVPVIAQEAFTLLEITISDALEKIQYWWVDNGEAITATVTTMWNGVRNMFQSAVQFISTLISWLVTNIQQFWKNHGEAIIKIVSDLWVWVTNAFNVATGVISSLFQAFTALLQGNWQGFIDKLLEAWDMLWGFIKQAAEAAWANLSTWFQGVIQSILTFFLTTDWGAIGRGIITGIWNALQAGWGWLVEQIKALAQQLFDAAMNFLNQHKGGGTGGIQYPGMNGGPQGAQSFGATQSVNGMLGGMASMAAGPVTNTYNYANNYNLNLTTTQTTQSVRTSFAIMQMLAG